MGFGLRDDALEDLRLISNVNADKDQLLQIILVGQPGLRKNLRRPELVQFAHRIGVDFHLDALDVKETREYIRHRVKVAGGDPKLFSTKACEMVHRYSRGMPRLINVLCDTALVYGYGSNKKRITETLVEEVVEDKRKGGLIELGPTTGNQEGSIAQGQSSKPAPKPRLEPRPLEPRYDDPRPRFAGPANAPVIDANDRFGESELVDDSEQQDDLFRELFSRLRNE